MAYWKPGSTKPTEKGDTEGLNVHDEYDSIQDFALLNNDEKGALSVVYNPRRHLPLQQQRRQLPVYSHCREFVWAVQVSKVVIVVGETGTGKSTQLPQYLKEAQWTSDGRWIIVCVPMRIAAVTLASRVAEELGTPLGEEVGFCTSEESCASDSCGIRYITDGVLLQLIQADPLLFQVAVVILDDCHQRRSQTDLLLGLLKKVQQKRPYLRLVMSSATIDTEVFVNFFHSRWAARSTEPVYQSASLNTRSDQRVSRWDTREEHKREETRGEISNRHHPCALPETLRDVSIVRISGRLYPITYKYLTEPCKDYIAAAYEAVLHIHQSSRDTDAILVFLCGREDVELLSERLKDARLSDGHNATSYGQRLKDLDICPLYGALSSDLQLAAFRRPAVGHRKVVVSTNIAESAVTIDRVGYVVDCGFVKISCYDPSSRATVLCSIPVSVASAQQRAGRAGRTRPGVCYRLYTEKFYKTSMHLYSIPELLRVNLTDVVLYILSLGVDNFVSQMDLPTPVSSESLIVALADLHALEAIDDLGRLTDFYGKRMAELLPLDPMVSRFVLYSTKDTVECSYEATIIAAMITCGSPWIVPPAKSRLKQGILEACMRSIGVREGDLVTLYNVYKQAEFYRSEDPQWEARHMINSKVLQRAERLKKHLEKRLALYGIEPVSAGNNLTALRKAICAGFFLNAACRQRDGSYQLCCSSQRIAGSHGKLPPLAIHHLSLTNPQQPLFVVFQHAIATAGLSSSVTQMINVTPIDPGWLSEVAGHHLQFQLTPSSPAMP